MDFWLVVFKPYDIILNNQQRFDFSYWPGHATFPLNSGSPHSSPDSSQITISSHEGCPTALQNKDRPSTYSRTI
jgi:hypothetical protein